MVIIAGAADNAVAGFAGETGKENMAVDAGIRILLLVVVGFQGSHHFERHSKEPHLKLLQDQRFPLHSHYSPVQRLAVQLCSTPKLLQLEYSLIQLVGELAKHFRCAV